MNKFLDRGFKSIEPPNLDGIPFSQELVHPGDLHQRTRLRHYLAIMDAPLRPVLDVGARNWIGTEIEAHYQVTLMDSDFAVDNTKPCDFNTSLDTWQSHYGTILCFEVIEHVMNPLLLLKNIYDKLDSEGTLYLSTPLSRPIGIYCCDMHFVEYKQSHFLEMLEHVGFRVDKSDVFYPWPWWFYLSGFRPMLRLVSHKIQLYKLEKG